MGTDEVHLQVLRELVDDVAKPLPYLRSLARQVKFPLIGKGEI